MMSNIQKLFTDRIEIYGDVDLNKTAIFTGIAKIALKVLV